MPGKLDGARVAVTLSLALVLILGIDRGRAAPDMAATPLKRLKLAAITCRFLSDRTSGINRICFYDCLGSEAAITIPLTSVCPLSISQ
jgi:hypothetical protein